MAVLMRQARSGAGTIILVLMMLVAGACGGKGTAPETKLDPETGATIQRAGLPIRFYRDNSGRAAYARDYIYVGPLSVNRMGSYHYYLWLGVWSTHSDNVGATARHDELEEITIIADGEPLALDVAGWTPGTIGVSAPVYEKPVASAIDAFYLVTLDQIRLISEARDVSIRTATGGSGRYEVWADDDRGAEAMRQFVRETR